MPVTFPSGATFDNPAQKIVENLMMKPFLSALTMADLPSHVGRWQNPLRDALVPLALHAVDVLIDSVDVE